MTKKRLIVGLGNPGAAYEFTRHNIGFRIVRKMAEQKGFLWRQSAHVKGALAQGGVGEDKIFFLMPATYMNQSGEAVRLCLDYFEVPLEEMIVVSDDIALPLGKIRMRTQGSSGGHNGLKSVEAHVRTQYYTRLRVGVGDREHGDLSDYVLGRFSEEEAKRLPEIETKAVAVLDVWIEQGISAAMQRANQEGENNG